MKKPTNILNTSYFCHLVERIQPHVLIIVIIFNLSRGKMDFFQLYERIRAMDKFSLIKQLCEQKGVKVTNVETELGFSKGSLSKMANSMPSADKIYKLAKYFDVPMEIFFEGTPLEKHADAIIWATKYAEKYNNDPEFRALSDWVDSELEQYEKRKASKPVFDVAAGEGRVNGEYATEYMDDEAKDGYSWCTVCGDSMLPELHDGDRIKVRHLTETTKSDMTVVKVDGESVTVKFVEITDNGVWLRALNKAVYEDRFFTIREVMTLPVKIIGKVVEVRRSYE